MNNFFRTLTFGAALLTVVSIEPASASLSIASTPNSPVNGLTFLPIGNAIGAGTYNGANYSVVAFTDANQGFVQGSTNIYAAPVTGPNVGNTVQTYTGTYLSTGATNNNGVGTIAFNFNAPQKAFALLWGSVDPSNKIDFLLNGSTVGSVFGTDVTSPANGFQGYGGSRYVEIDSTLAFNQIKLTSGQISFEGAEFEAGAATPEPGVYGMMLAGFGILGSAFYMRRRKAAATTPVA